MKMRRQKDREWDIYPFYFQLPFLQGFHLLDCLLDVIGYMELFATCFSWRLG